MIKDGAARHQISTLNLIHSAWPYKNCVQKSPPEFRFSESIIGQFPSKFSLCVTPAVFGPTIWQNMKASSVVAGHSLFPTTRIIHTRGGSQLTLVGSTKSPAQSSSAAALTR